MEELEIEMNIFEQTYNSEEYEVWDEEKHCWVDYKSSCYVAFEFPKPTEAKYPINLITVKDSKTSKVHTFGTTQ